MKKPNWILAVYAMLIATTLIFSQNAYALTKRPPKENNQLITPKKIENPPQTRDMQVATGEIPLVNEQKADY